MGTEVSGVVLEVLVANPDPYAPIEPVASLLEALAEYFAALSGIASAKRGWPEYAEQLDLTGGPVVTATLAGEPVRTPVPLAPLGGSPPQWKTAELGVTVMLDLWTAYRAQRDDAARLVEDAFHNRLPFQPGLYLVSKGYYQRPIVATAGGGRDTNPDAAAAVGEWRRTWMLSVVTDLVTTTSTPTQTTITLQPTVQGVVEPDTDIS